MSCNCVACRKYRFRKFAHWYWWRETALGWWRQAKYAAYVLRSRKRQGGR
jgi:hypothetical protein